jgi:Beta propeller domain
MQKLQCAAARTGVSIVGAAYILGLVACSGQSTGESFAKVHGDLTADQANAAALSSGSSCDELLAQLQNQLLTQVSERAEQARISGAPYYGGGVFIDDVAPSFSGPVPASIPASAPRASAPLASIPVPSIGTAGLSAATVQETSVETGDIVKSDVDHIYLVHGTELLVLGAESAAATEILATAPIEGQPVELLVRDGRVVVFSYVYGPLPGSGDDYSPYYYYYPTYTKITVLDAASGSLDVLRESYVEGGYGSSRRDGAIVRAALQQSYKAQLDYPNISYVDIFGHPRTQADIDLQVNLWALLSTESIEASQIEDYVPNAFERVGSELVRQPLHCGDYLVPGAGLTQAGATGLITLDLDAVSAPLGNLTVLGYADYVYTGAESIILRQSDYTSVASELPSVATNLHRFTIDGASTTYSGSGRITGYVPGQFGLDESNGVVRAVTSEDRYGTDADAGGGYVYLGSTSHVLTLAADTLTELGRSADFSPDEYIIFGRFVGDRGYVLSAGESSRLSVVDLSDPAAPAISGSLPTTGYTSLIYPLSDRSLLALGQTVDATGSLERLSLRLFDVSVASAPNLAHEFVFQEQGYSDALYEPRALTVDPRRSAIALPFQNYTTGVASLEVFRVSPAAGFTQLGHVVPPTVDLSLLECLQLLGYPTDPESLAELEQDPALAESLRQSCEPYSTDYVRRGLFRGKDLYAIGDRSVTTYSLDALSDPPLSQIVLPYSYYQYPGPYPIYATPAAPIE